MKAAVIVALVLFVIAVCGLLYVVDNRLDSIEAVNTTQQAALEQQAKSSNHNFAVLKQLIDGKEDKSSGWLFNRKKGK